MHPVDFHDDLPVLLAFGERFMHDIMKKRRPIARAIFSYSILIVGIGVSLATSVAKSQRKFAIGLYQVQSDCPNALPTGQVIIAASPPDAESYTIDPGTSFGFPSNLLRSGTVKGGDASGTVTSEDSEQICKALLWETEANSGIFACYRANDLQCTIHLEKI
jgi:hypothetical protein